MNKYKTFQASDALYLKSSLHNIPKNQNSWINTSLKPKIMPFQLQNKMEQEGTAAFNNSD
jgi:hypothetical protein